MMITAFKPKNQVVLYSIHESDRGQKVRWLLEEMTVPYDVVLMNRKAMPEKYAEINPMMCVPTLEFDGKTMFESTAILAFLADRFAEKGLAPSVESSDRHLYLQWLIFSEASLERALGRYWLVEDIPNGAKCERYEELREEVDSTLQTINQALKDREYLLGSRFSAADIAVSYYLNR